jgi:hypothetical protein
MLNQGAVAQGPPSSAKSSAKISSPLHAKAGLAATANASIAPTALRKIVVIILLSLCSIRRKQVVTIRFQVDTIRFGATPPAPPEISE